jgi:hypothetical protein
MRNWKLEFDGALLRDTINNGNDEFLTLEILKKELGLFIKNIRDEDMKYEFEDLHELVCSEVDGGKAELLDWLDSEDIADDLEEFVNGRLTEFYDLCDRWDVWVKTH